MMDAMNRSLNYSVAIAAFILCWMTQSFIMQLVSDIMDYMDYWTNTMYYKNHAGGAWPQIAAARHMHLYRPYGHFDECPCSCCFIQ